MQQKSGGKRGLRAACAAFSRPVDLTHGTPWRVILLYAAPIILSYYLQQVYTLTDAIICGQVLTAEQVAGVNDTFPLTFIFLQFAFGCTAGFSVITANCVGSRDARGVRRSFAAQIELSLVISAFLTVLSILLLPQMLALINVTPAHGEVYTTARTYCLIIFIGTVAQIGYNLICGILRAFGDSFTPLLFLTISTLLNVGLDLLFLVPLRMGPAGAAIATVAAQLLSLVGCTIYTLRKYPEQATVVAIDRAFNPQTGTIRVQANLPNADYLLRPGMFIIATARLATVKNALTVPAKSLLSTQGRFFVIVLDGSNHPSIIPVQAGTQLGDRQQVIPLKPDSLTPQSKVVVDGLLQAEAASRNPAARLKAAPASNQ